MQTAIFIFLDSQRIILDVFTSLDRERFTTVVQGITFLLLIPLSIMTLENRRVLLPLCIHISSMQHFIILYSSIALFLLILNLTKKL